MANEVGAHVEEKKKKEISKGFDGGLSSRFRHLSYNMLVIILDIALIT